jgi:excisionase family DNA binding protein
MTAVQPLPRFLTIDQLAGHLGVTPRHVRRLVAERRVPFVKVGYFVRFDPQDIRVWVQSRRVDSSLSAPSRGQQ